MDLLHGYHFPRVHMIFKLKSYKSFSHNDILNRKTLKTKEKFFTYRHEKHMREEVDNRLLILRQASLIPVIVIDNTRYIQPEREECHLQKR